MAEDRILLCACDDPQKGGCKHHQGNCGSPARVHGWDSRQAREKAAPGELGTPFCVPCAAARVGAGWWMRSLPGLWKRG